MLAVDGVRCYVQDERYEVIGWISWQAQMRVVEIGRVLPGGQVCSWHNCRLISILSLSFLSQQVEWPLSNAQMPVGGICLVPSSAEKYDFERYQK